MTTEIIIREILSKTTRSEVQLINEADEKRTYLENRDKINRRVVFALKLLNPEIDESSEEWKDLLNDYVTSRFAQRALSSGTKVDAEGKQLLTKLAQTRPQLVKMFIEMARMLNKRSQGGQTLPITKLANRAGLSKSEYQRLLDNHNETLARLFMRDQLPPVLFRKEEMKWSEIDPKLRKTILRKIVKDLSTIPNIYKLKGDTRSSGPGSKSVTTEMVLKRLQDGSIVINGKPVIIKADQRALDKDMEDMYDLDVFRVGRNK